MADKKLVRATVKETLMSDLGRLEKGRTYEIPEGRFTAWEKSGLVVKEDGEGKGKDGKKTAGDERKE